MNSEDGRQMSADRRQMEKAWKMKHFIWLLFSVLRHLLPGTRNLFI